MKKYLSGKFQHIKKLIRTLIVITFIAVGLTIALIGPIDRTSLLEQAFYSQMMTRLDSCTIRTVPKNQILAAWEKINITPDLEMPMAGYKPRNHFESVHDSLFARLLLFQIGNESILMLNVDLLIFPPDLKTAINKKIREKNLNVFLYLSATHTHNGLGGWDDSALGKLVSGTYHEEWIESVSNEIVNAIINLRPKESSVKYWENHAEELVVNRIAYSKGEVDGKLRGLQIFRTDSTKALLFTFSAHPTSITKKSLSLSADYPGKTIELVEQDFDFGIFLGGMVGSHSFTDLQKQNFELVDLEADLLYSKIMSAENSMAIDSISISYSHIPIEFGPSQLRISDNWKVRNWVLSSLFGGLNGELTYLRLGNTVMIGTPCDFSGEIFVRDSLEEFTRQYNKDLIITSFNGDYVGYITYDGHYDSIKNVETREMNWVGPYYGEYFSTMMRMVIEKDGFFNAENMR